ncbi:prepilin peptidase [Conexibacter woesei]|uniref:prepilin peptidase n=1 Tax=Conexibacter woesei TaxID=191495 RepID=UPI0002D5CADD|nr:A24 family peptidase [Conexibacter woesei]
MRGDLAHVRRHAPLAVALWALLAGGVVLTAASPRDVALGLVLTALLVPIALIDVAVRLIPNWATAAGAFAAVALGLATDPAAVGDQLLAGAAAAALLLLAALARPGDMGMGDVKLAGMLGLFLGAEVAVALLAGFVAAALAGLVLLIRHGAAGARRATLPLGPFLALGAAVALYAGAPLLDAYLTGLG